MAAALAAVLTAGALSGCSGFSLPKELHFSDWISSAAEEGAGSSASSDAQAVRSVTVQSEDGAPEGSAGAAETASEGTDGFSYGTLTESQQETYKELYTGISQREETVTVSAGDDGDVQAAITALLDDHPEFFWLDGSATMVNYPLIGVCRLTFQFNIDASQIDSVQAAIDAEAAKYLAQIPAGAGEYDKVKLAYEWLIENTEYVSDSAQNQNIQSVFLYHESVCAGYAKAMKYLLNKAGVSCAYIEGSVTDPGNGGTESHAWDLVSIDGTYTYVDPSWGDPTYGENAADTGHLPIIYDYLCLTTEEMTRSGHVPDPKFTNLPDCSSTAYDYYRLNGMFYESGDADVLSQALWSAVENDAGLVYMKFASWDAYSEAVGLLLDGKSDLISAPLQEKMKRDGNSSMNYYTSKSDTLWIIKIYW